MWGAERGKVRMGLQTSHHSHRPLPQTQALELSPAPLLSSPLLLLWAAIDCGRVRPSAGLGCACAET